MWRRVEISLSIIEVTFEVILVIVEASVHVVELQMFEHGVSGFVTGGDECGKRDSFRLKEVEEDTTRGPGNEQCLLQDL